MVTLRLAATEEDDRARCNSVDDGVPCTGPGDYCVYWKPTRVGDRVGFTLSCATHAHMARMHKASEVFLMRTWYGADDSPERLEPPLPPLYA